MQKHLIIQIVKIHGDQLNVDIDTCMYLVCLSVWCLSPFALLVFRCLEENEQHYGPHQFGTMLVSSKSNVTKAYFKRFQIKYMNRRARKIHYRAIIHLTTQDENKYNTSKYNYVVKFTHKNIVVQITTYATKIC